MAISLDSVKRSGEPKPTIDLIYAPQGMGKTTLAAGAPNPIFLQTEDGLGILEMPTFGLLRTYAQFVEAMHALATQPHNYRTVIVDSAGWLEPLIWDETCRLNGWANIEAPGYGKGPIAAANVWRVVLNGLTYLRDALGMGVIILAHAQSKKQEPPDGEDYDRYQPKLHDRATAMLQEFADGVFFINTRVSVIRSVPKDEKSRGLATGNNKRYLYTTTGKPTYMAKNRFSMPEMIVLPSPPIGVAPDPFSLFSALAIHIPYYRNLLEGKVPAAPTENSIDNTQENNVVEDPFAKLKEVKEETEADTDENQTQNAAE